jgi:hypothetical protein
VFKAKLGKKVTETPSQQYKQAWWCTLVVPATQEAEVRRIKFQTQPSSKILSKENYRKKKKR